MYKVANKKKIYRKFTILGVMEAAFMYMVKLNTPCLLTAIKTHCSVSYLLKTSNSTNPAKKEHHYCLCSAVYKEDWWEGTKGCLKTAESHSKHQNHLIKPLSAKQLIWVCTVKYAIKTITAKCGNNSVPASIKMSDSIWGSFREPRPLRMY